MSSDVVVSVAATQYSTTRLEASRAGYPGSPRRCGWVGLEAAMMSKPRAVPATGRLWATTFGWPSLPCGWVRCTTDRCNHRGGRPPSRCVSSGQSASEAPVDPAGRPVAVTPAALIQRCHPSARGGTPSCAAIARKLTMPSSTQAQAAFIRGVRHRPRQERIQLVERELGRLDKLEKKIRGNAGQDPNKASQQLAAVEKLRSALQ